MEAALARRRAAFARIILRAEPDDAVGTTPLGRRTGGTRPIGADTGRIRIPGAACKAAGAEACEHKRWVVTHGLSVRTFARSYLLTVLVGSTLHPALLRCRNARALCERIHTALVPLQRFVKQVLCIFQTLQSVQR